MKILQLGLGQQGTRNLQKLEILSKESFPIEIVGIADLFKEKRESAQQNEIAKRARVYENSKTALIKELPSKLDVVFDSTSTPQHSKNLETTIKIVKDNPRSKPRIYSCEKPVFTSLNQAERIYKDLKENGIELTENSIELFSDTKQASISDIAKNHYDILGIKAVRGGPVKDKAIATERNIYRDFGGAWMDKSVHDISKALATYNERYGALPEPEIEDSKFYLLKLTSDKKEFYYTRDGEVVTSLEDAQTKGKEVNEAYSKVNFKLGSMPVEMISSWVEFNQEDKETMSKWFSKEIINVVEKKARKKITPPSNIKEDGEVRLEYIGVETPQGKGGKYLTSTYGDFFTIKQIGNNEPEVLQYGGADFHLEYIRDSLQYALGGKERPFITAENILYGTRILDEAKEKAYADAVNKKRTITLDLRKEKGLEELIHEKP